MSKKKTYLCEDDRIRAEEADQKQAEFDAGVMEMTAEANAAQEADKLPGTRVYCGPSVRNVVRQYTVFEGEIPPALEGFLRKHSAARALLVKLEGFPATRAALGMPRTPETVIYQKIKSEL